MCFGFRISCTIYVNTLNIPLHNLKFPKNAKNMDNTAASGSLFMVLSGLLGPYSNAWRSQRIQLFLNFPQFLHFQLQLVDNERRIWTLILGFWFRNTCEKVKSDLWNRFKLQIAMGNFFGHPEDNFRPWRLPHKQSIEWELFVFQLSF